jgi:hypothetical protein
MADIFISYKSERRRAAEHLAEILTDYGYTVWWDYGLVSGGDFGVQIEAQLRDAKCAIVLWCSLSRESRWVLEEAELAQRLNIILPAMIERADLPLGFARSQTVDLCDWDGAPQSHRLERLLRDVAAMVGRPIRRNEDGLARTDRASRRFGAPTLAQFALLKPPEKQEPPRNWPTSPEALAQPPKPPPASPKPDAPYVPPPADNDVRRPGLAARLVRLVRKRPLIFVVAALVAGALLAWFFAPRPPVYIPVEPVPPATAEAAPDGT